MARSQYMMVYAVGTVGMGEVSHGIQLPGLDYGLHSQTKDQNFRIKSIALILVCTPTPILTLQPFSNHYPNSNCNVDCNFSS